MPPQNVRYQALGPLLSGEGSRAFLGLATADGSEAQPVVMIWLPPDVADDTEQVTQVHKETQRAVTLEHPNIIKVFGLAAMEEGIARIVEFADGETLRRVLEVCQKLPLPLAALLIADAATGLHYAHLAGNDDGTPLIHGDLRPETLMVCFSGLAKVSGYGALSVAPRETGGKRVIHRRLYSAPEQIIGGRGAFSVQTDVYLLGIMLYECLTGVMAFQGEASFDQAVVNTPLALTAHPEIPEALVPVLQRATAKRAQDRYPSALAFREAVEAAVGQLPGHEEFSQFLEQRFPESDPARAARRRVLEAGLADYARKMWDPKAQASGLKPMIAAPSVAVSRLEKPPAEKPAPRPAPASAPRNGAGRATAPSAPSSSPPERPSGETPVHQPSRSLVPVVVVSALMAAVATFIGSKLLGGRAQAPAPAPAMPAAAAARPAPQPAPAGTQAAERQPGADEEGAAHERESPKAVKPAAFKAPALATLQLSVTPPVEVLVDKKPMGRPPLTLPLSPGRHVLQLRDRAQGIFASRAITMPAHGTEVQNVTLAKGFLSVTVPSGAAIYLDGKGLGSASIEDVPIWEGGHHLVVMLGSAKWQQTFEVAAGEHMKYDVQSTPQP